MRTSTEIALLTYKYNEAKIKSLQRENELLKQFLVSRVKRPAQTPDISYSDCGDYSVVFTCIDEILINIIEE